MNTTSRPSKRLNQTDISSYLTIHSTPNLTHPSNQAPAPSPSPQPQLPPTIQSSLLNVGMRVRKAVPEGYKTKRFFENPIPVHRDSHRVYGTGSYNGHAELVPYCGISKVGGYMAQECSLENGIDVLGSGMLFDEDDGLDGGGVPSLSQESVLMGPGCGGLLWSWRGEKRRLIDGDEDGGEDEDEEVGVECAGRHNASSGNVSVEGPIALRPIAQARNRRRDVTSKLKGACDGDFGEAPFLRDLQEDMGF